MGKVSPSSSRERRLQLAARRRGFRLIHDRASARSGMKRYFLRPTWDARRTVLPLTQGGWVLANILDGRRVDESLMSLDEIERLIERGHALMHAARSRLARLASDEHGY